MKIHHVVRHGFDFLLLLFIVALGLGGLLYFRFDVAAQIAVTFLMAIFYIFWGMYHHYHDGDLTTHITFEYIAMASLVSFILIIFLLRV